MKSENKQDWFKVTQSELKHLFQVEKDPTALTKLLLWVVSALLTPITLAGALLGFVRGYNRFMQRYGAEPELYPLLPIIRVAMIIGGFLIWVVLFIAIWTIYHLLPDDWVQGGKLFYFIGINLLLSVVVFGAFRQWRLGIKKALSEEEKFGTARFAGPADLIGYAEKTGIYLGGSYTFSESGHLLTCAGTRSGKFTNLIAPNLLGLGGYEGGWVVIDPKGEICAVTARYQRESGKNVVVLNPWGLLEDRLGESQCYNPLDILEDKNSPHLVDDVQVIAEMIVPQENGNRETFFADNARAVVAGLLLHLATTANKKDRTLKTLWQWVRLPKAKFNQLLADMATSDSELYGDVVQQAAHQITKLIEAGDKTFGSIIATALQCTDFIKSPALQENMQSGFDPKELSGGNTTLYIIIPADKLQSHSRWLRLVVTTTMRAVVRNPNKRVCFLLDEFASLGYLPEVSEIALSTYAGFNITVWPIIQSLIQLKNIYGDGWENFIGNTAVRHVFGVNDNFTADYISAAIGMSSNMSYTKNIFGMIQEVQANQRELVTPDELRRGSGQYIFAFMGNKPVTFYSKRPYYEIPFLKNGDVARFDDNPYFK